MCCLQMNQVQLYCPVFFHGIMWNCVCRELLRAVLAVEGTLSGLMADSRGYLMLSERLGAVTPGCAAQKRAQHGHRLFFITTFKAVLQILCITYKIHLEKTVKIRKVNAQDISS